jgi:proteic killer suppression protein
MLHYAKTLADLRSPPGNRLEALRGDLRGRHSVRVSDQWRVVFRWTDAGPVGVDVVDYHG